ncbi:hypothetical protein Mal15_34780 [Stieleria maiorica]|uniref:DUF4350 domain-containing protein n=1 Tax=Stieleria maiorica TaxID=2795974 RepID=A0A5B9MIE0_9BACT|nr:hypothetical protein [Stieleria maiorica]QEF99414.1 hypothetical protein Mal15_34780 [Stieleria maiorica]
MKRIIVPLLLLLLFAGCDGGLRTGYGPSKGILARRSVNGFTSLRNAFSSAGFSTRDLNRLTDRARRTSVIVWTPTHPTGIENRTTRWLEQWLKLQQKTLIYVVPDSGSEAEFYRDARPFASPPQRLEYRRKYAESLIQEHQWQLARTTLPSNGWLSIQPDVQRTKILLDNATAGDAAEHEAAAGDAAAGDAAAGDAAAGDGWDGVVDIDTPRRIEWVLKKYDRKDKSQQGTPILQPAGPGAVYWPQGQSVSSTSAKTKFESVLVSEDDDTILARITCDAWPNSQVLVVAGGSLLTNYALTQPQNQALAQGLIRSSIARMHPSKRAGSGGRLVADGSQPQAGFAFAPYSLPISNRSGEIPRASGAEFFTEFPLSFVTFHIAILGFVICLTLLPIFGRPRRVDRGVLTHFGDHLSAVATLMRRRGGETFARRRISDYMKHVRDEASGPWVIDEPVHETDPAIHLHLPAPKPPAESVTAVDTAVVRQESTERPRGDSHPTDRG